MARIAGTLLTCLLLAAAARGAESVLSLPEGLPALRGWAGYDLVLGRLRASSARSCGQSTCGREHAAAGITESYLLQASAGSVQSRYDAAGADDSFTALVHGPAARIEYRRGEAVVWALDQPAQGPVTLTYDDSGKPRKMKGQTVWHLLLAAPAEPRVGLAAILGLHRRDWDLVRQADEVAAALVRVQSPAARPGDRELLRLVGELKGPTFALRREAQRKLAGQGHAAYPFLAALDPAALDAQQRLACRDLMANLAAGGPDSPERVALWLAGDEAVWRALAERGTPAQQSAARLRLGRGIETAATSDRGRD